MSLKIGSNTIYIRNENGEFEEAAISENISIANTAAENAAQSAKSASESADKAETAKTSAESAMNSAKASADSAAESESNAKASAESAKAVADSIPTDYSELSRTKADGIVETVEGKTITANDCSDMPLRGLRIFGKTTQESTKGTNVLRNDWYDLRTNEPSIRTTFDNVGVCTITTDATSNFESSILFNESPFTLLDTITSVYFKIICLDNAIKTFNYQVALKTSDNQLLSAEYLSGNVANSISRNDTVMKMSADDFKTVKKFQFYFYGVTEDNPLKAGTQFQIIFSTDPSCVYEPYTGGQPSPSPDYPQELVSVGADGEIGIDISDDSDNHQTAEFLCPNGLPGIKVTSNGNYTDEDGQQWICDEIDLERGVYVQRVERIEVPGFSLFATYENTKRVHANFPTTVIGGIYAKGFCDKFPWLYNNDDKPHFYWGDVATGVVVYVPLDTDITNYPLTFAGALATPIETALTDEEISTYKFLHTNKPNTTFTNDSEAYMSVDYTADTKTYIDNKFTELQTALLSTGGDV